MTSLPVHRCRFIEWAPSAITTIAIHPSGETFATGHANGDVFLYSRRPAIFCALRLPGSAKAPVQSIAWAGPSVDSMRLFSGSLNSIVTEWNLEQCAARAAHDAFGGAIWCLSTSFSGQILATGGEDGGLRLFRPVDEPGEMDYVRSFPRCDGRILSLGWSPDDKSVVCGSSQGLVRLLSVETGACLCRFTLQSAEAASVLAWACCVLPDGSIATGDSDGLTQIWESKHGTLIEKFGGAAKADVTCLAVSGSRLWRGGIDGKVMVYKSTLVGKRPKWVLQATHRQHSHDVPSTRMHTRAMHARMLAHERLHAQRHAHMQVRAMSIGGQPSVVLSGSLDGTLCQYACSDQHNSSPSS